MTETRQMVQRLAPFGFFTPYSGHDIMGTAGCQVDLLSPYLSWRYNTSLEILMFNVNQVQLMFYAEPMLPQCVPISFDPWNPQDLWDALTSGISTKVGTDTIHQPIRVFPGTWKQERN